jgi:YidC/Oxa1 family membrane protein insertase
LLNPLYIAVSWVLLQWHRLFSTFLSPVGGLSWALSILMLVVTIRVVLFRFFIKQVHNQRKMQEIQPKIAALREKYKSDRQTLSQEMMKLQKEEGFNPIGGCLPILMQAPIFLSLFHVLRLIGTNKAHFLHDEYHWRQDEVTNAGAAKLFGAPIAAAFRTPLKTLETLQGDQTATRVVTFVLIVLMCAATYITQRQIMSRSGQVLDGQQAMIQKLLLYGMPISLFVSGFLFPLGVLLYWFTNNLWTMGQQFYILHRMPPPGAKKDDPNKPAVDPKTLAPRPGQKPVNLRAKRPATTTPALPVTPDDATDATGSSPAKPAKAAPAKSAKAIPAKPAKAAKAGSAKAAAGPTAEAVDPTAKAADPAVPAADASANGDGSGRLRSRRRRGVNGTDGADGTAAAPPPGMRGLRDPDGDLSDGTVDATADDAPADGDQPAAVEPVDGGPANGTPKPGPTNAPRPARRPPARRPSTTTGPKKKRR